MKIGIIGNGADKFTPLGKDRALHIIDELLRAEVCLVSGHSPVGGVDIWAEDMAEQKGLEKHIYPAKVNKWEGGYKDRNLQIAQDSDEVHVIVVDRYPPKFYGHKFSTCYHHVRKFGAGKFVPHVKSGACWTGFEAIALGKFVQWHVVENI